LTLPIEACTPYGEPISEFKINTPNIYLFPNEGTQLLAPWDGIVTIIEATEDAPNKGGVGIYVRNQSVSVKQPEFRMYVSRDPNNSLFGSFLPELNGASVKRGDLLGYVGKALPSSMTESSATVMLIFGINEVGYFNPFDTKYWAGNQILYFAPDGRY